ncbi:hypothetical protein [Bacillus phage vB_BanS-Thrax5]|nr:hypothetical protein [Bacillus phage vB_BanS-Thrax5]
MKFKLVNGEMSLVKVDAVSQMNSLLPLTSTSLVVDIPKIKESIHRYVREGLGDGRFATVAIGGTGVFWKAFLMYIFPWFCDIAKVFCLIKIAQAFYEEKRAGKDGASGMGAIFTYGKFYIMFLMLPWFVELIDQIGGTMYDQVKANPTLTLPKR